MLVLARGTPEAWRRSLSAKNEIHHHVVRVTSELVFILDELVSTLHIRRHDSNLVEFGIFGLHELVCCVMSDPLRGRVSDPWLWFHSFRVRYGPSHQDR
jgi:hypothetical protein